VKFPWTLFALSLVPTVALVGRGDAGPGEDVAPAAVSEASVEEEVDAAEPPCDPEADRECVREDVPADADPAVIAYGSSS
jgi:hypothetical protein